MKIILLFLMIGCYETGTAEDKIFQELPEFNETATVTFEQVNEFVLTPFNCIGCHGDWATTATGLKTKLVAGDPSNSKLFLRVQDESMPLGGTGIGTERIDLIERYILDLRL